MLGVLLVVLLVLSLVVGAVRLLARLNQVGRQTPAKDWPREYIAEITEHAQPPPKPCGPGLLPPWRYISRTTIEASR